MVEHELRQKFLAAGDPAISVDAKKKELIGEFKNAGRTYRYTPYEVNAHDFPHDAVCKAVPYGVYDLTHNAARITVGTSGDTGDFAVAANRSWWQASGRDHFPKSPRLLIEADAGGSNGCRPRLWTRALQEFADETGLTVTAAQNNKAYPLHVKVSNADFNALNLHRHDVCPRWNYTIKPRAAKNTE